VTKVQDARAVEHLKHYGTQLHIIKSCVSILRLVLERVFLQLCDDLLEKESCSSILTSNQISRLFLVLISEYS